MSLEKQLSANHAVILSAVRTPIGSFQGSLASKSAVDLGAITIQQAVRASLVPPEDIDHVIMGQVLQAGCMQSTARQASIKGGLSVLVDTTTVNKACASSLKAVAYAAESILAGTNKIVVAGGMESMSNAPFLLSRKGLKYGGARIEDCITQDGLMCAFNHIHMGACTDQLASKHNISRSEQDEYAQNSYIRATDAWKNEIFKDEIVYVPVKNERTGEVTNVYEDEEYHKFRPEKMPKLKPAFTTNGTITAANASKLNDGASSLVICSSTEAQTRGLEPLADILAFADASVEPADFGIAPLYAIKKALKRIDLSVKDIALFEINEAFSVVPLVCAKELGVELDKVNIHGGAVALGHPVGASGARILTHLTYTLDPHQVGVAAICNGGGGASAMIIRKRAH